MSYYFDGSGDHGSANFTTSLEFPFTLGVFVKQATFIQPGSVISASANSTVYGRIVSGWGASNDWYAHGYDGTDEVIQGKNTDITALGWVPMLAVFTDSTTKEIYVNGVAGSNLAAATLDLASLTNLRIGRAPDATEYFTGYIARACAWKKALSGTELTDFNSGVTPTSIANADLQKWFELNTNNATQANGGNDSGDMTMTNAVYDADHPAFASGSPLILPHRSSGGMIDLSGNFRG